MPQRDRTLRTKTELWFSGSRTFSRSRTWKNERLGEALYLPYLPSNLNYAMITFAFANI